MTNDLISREALKKAISELPNANPSYWNKCDVVDREDVLDEIDNAQAVEAYTGTDLIEETRKVLILREDYMKNHKASG